MSDLRSLEVDPDLLLAFERGLDPRHPERSKIPARILGYGEISTVFEILAPGLEGLACKRLPTFRSRAELEAYKGIYLEYNRVLQEEVGLRLPRYGFACLVDDAGYPLFYILQERLPPESIGNRALHLLSSPDACRLVEQTLRELEKVWGYNRRQQDIQVALDGQISNWSIAGFDHDRPALGGEITLLYMDTSTPLFRVRGTEQLNPELFLRSAPSFLAWVLRLLYLKDVVNRYYDLRLVVVDLIANMYKEQRPDLVPPLIELANRFFAGAAAYLGARPLTVAEVRAYYREDAMIWSAYLAARKLDRFLRARLLRRRYPYILPERIRR
jgi:hypothetical protein